MNSPVGTLRNTSWVVVEVAPTREPGVWQVNISTALGKTAIIHLAYWENSGAIDMDMLEEIGQAAKIATMTLIRDCMGFQPTLFGGPEEDYWAFKVPAEVPADD